MKIAHFIPTLKREDGVAGVLLSIVRESLKRGHESVIVTGWVEDNSISPVPVIKIPSVVFPLYKEYHLPLPGMGGFEKELNGFKPDVIHVHAPETSAFAALKYAKKYGIPIFATHHTNFVHYLPYYHLSFLEPFLWSILRRLYNQVDMVTTPSPVTTEELLSHGIKRAATLQWGVDLGSFNPSFRSGEWRREILGDKGKIILLSVCRLTWEKDLRTLAEAYEIFKKNRDDFAMVVAGNGPAGDGLRSLMPGAVFMGRIVGEELSKVFASSDILLFPSTTETFGNVTIEAMASGVVPIAANAGGSKSIVENGKTGFLAKPKDPKDLYEKAVILIEDRELMGKMRSADLEIARTYSWENVFDGLLKIYGE